MTCKGYASSGLEFLYSASLSSVSLSCTGNFSGPAHNATLILDIEEKLVFGSLFLAGFLIDLYIIIILLLACHKSWMRTIFAAFTLLSLVFCSAVDVYDVVKELEVSTLTANPTSVTSIVVGIIGGVCALVYLIRITIALVRACRNFKIGGIRSLCYSTFVVTGSQVIPVSEPIYITSDGVSSSIKGVALGRSWEVYQNGQKVTASLKKGFVKEIAIDTGKLNIA
ncbi:hypothetical protein [Chinese broad-headed pond turtle arterivirus]|uniref:Uncharacterized protein n=1 Tax=Chinese broad-headed pond turtle arterivirus TaxID=2116345 RepID=A0A2P1GMZ2_9NIDO|nr:hypothetical protein [Chinese broad-headed pond turtle arterivirus]AVM87334.1 hypothetical protein [Chinese broad-headed pond turtle arterivirus]